MEVPFGATRENLACIHEECHIEAAEDLPSVLAVYHHQIVVVEAKGTEAAQIVRPAQHGLKIEGHSVAPVRIGQHSLAMERNHSPLVEKWDILLQLHLKPLKTVKAQFL